MMLQTTSNSNVVAVLPASITFTFALSFSDRLSQAHLLIACIRGIVPASARTSVSIVSLNFLRAVAAFHHELQPTSSSFTQFVADRFQRVWANFVSVPTFFRVFFSSWVAANSPSLAAPSTFATAVGLLIVTSEHCSSTLPGTVATTSILAILILSTPCLSLCQLNHCGATLFKSAVAPILRICLARLSRTLYSSSPSFLLTCQGVVPSFILEHATFTQKGLFDPKSQPPPGCCFPFVVGHPSLWRGFSPRGSSTMKFFLLSFNNFTSFLYPSSVIISLEFVFLKLRLTFGEDLLFLSVHKSSNLCVFSVWLQTTCHNRPPCSFHNGSHRSFGHGRRRLTDRQAFSLGVIDMHSVCVTKHPLERGVIVIPILEEPLLGDLWVGQGLCVGLDLSLHEVVFLGLITCGEVRTRQ